MRHFHNITRRDCIKQDFIEAILNGSPVMIDAEAAVHITGNYRDPWDLKKFI